MEMMNQYLTKLMGGKQRDPSTVSEAGRHSLDRISLTPTPRGALEKGTEVMALTRCFITDGGESREEIRTRVSVLTISPGPCRGEPQEGSDTNIGSGDVAINGARNEMGTKSSSMTTLVAAIPNGNWVAQRVHTMSQPKDQLPAFIGKSQKKYGLFI